MTPPIVSPSPEFKIIHSSHLSFLEHILHCFYDYILLLSPPPDPMPFEIRNHILLIFRSLFSSLLSPVPLAYTTVPPISQLVNKCLLNVTKFCGLGREKEPVLSEFYGNLSQNEVTALDWPLPFLLDVEHTWKALVSPKPSLITVITCFMSSLPIRISTPLGQESCLI